MLIGKIKKKRADMEVGFKKREIERSFHMFQDYVSYVFRADYVTFPTFFDNLINFCENDIVMKVITSQLKEIEISYDNWYQKLKKYENGKPEFRLPYDEVQRSSLLYKICIKIHNNEINVFNFCLDFDNSLHLNDTVNFFNANILTPLIDSIGYKIKDISETINEEYKESTSIPFTIFNVYHDNSVTIGDSNIFTGDAAIGRETNLEKKCNS
jgi:hypothetical protein